MAVYNGTVLKKAYKGDYGPCQIYKGTKKYAGFTNYPYTGSTISLTDTYNDTLDLTVRGATFQAGTPRHGTPSEPLMVGDLVTNVQDINYGKYKIPVVVNGVSQYIFVNQSLMANKANVYDELNVTTGVVTRKTAKANMCSFLTAFVTEFENSAIEPENLRIVIPNTHLTYERLGGYPLPITPLTAGVNTLGYSNRYFTYASYDGQPAFVVIPPNPNIYFYYDSNALGVTTQSTKRQVRDAILSWLSTATDFYLTYQVQTPYTETTQGLTLRTQAKQTTVKVGCKYPAPVSAKIKRMVL